MLGGAAMTGLWGQSKPVGAGTTEAGTKIAAINMRLAIANTAEGKQAATQLETQFQSRRKELEDLNKRINEIQQKLSASENVLSEEEKQKLNSEGQKLSRQLDRRQSEFQEDLNDAQSEVVSRIGRRIVEVLGKYAPSNGYGAVLDNSSQTTPVMYASTDITEAIVKMYDQTYPVKDTASTNGKPSGK
jgi:outer membrane protein